MYSLLIKIAERSNYYYSKKKELNIISKGAPNFIYHRLQYVHVYY